MKTEANGSVTDLGTPPQPVIGVVKIGKKKKKKKIQLVGDAHSRLFRSPNKITNELLNLLPVDEIQHIVEEFNSLIEGRVDDILKDLGKTLGKRSYALVGGFAVKAYISKGRTLTPDIDLLVSSSDKDTMSRFLDSSDLKIQSKGLWISTMGKGGVELDYKVASDAFEKEVIQNAVAKKFKGQKIYVASVEYLIVMKLMLLRDKDENDIILLLKSKEIDQKKLMKLVTKYANDKVEDLAQLTMMSDLVKT